MIFGKDFQDEFKINSLIKFILQLYNIYYLGVCNNLDTDFDA
jgi:hypothetical protein